MRDIERLLVRVSPHIIFGLCCASYDLWYHHVVFQPALAKQSHVPSEVFFSDVVYSAEGQKLFVDGEISDGGPEIKCFFSTPLYLDLTRERYLAFLFPGLRVTWYALQG